MSAVKSLPKGIIFDLDGTLIDSAPDIAAAVNKVIGTLGREPLSVAYVEGFIGEGARSMLRRLFADLGIEVGAEDLERHLAAYLDNYQAEPVVRTQFYAAVEDDLRRLKAAGIRLGICTNKPHDLTRIVLDGLGVSDLFDAVRGADAVKRRKPDQAHLMAVVDDMGLDREDIYYVGDTEIDRACAHAAGIAFFIVDWGGGVHLADGSDTRIRRLTDLLTLNRTPEIQHK